MPSITLMLRATDHRFVLEDRLSSLLVRLSSNELQPI